MAMNDHLREASMAQRNRTPIGELLLEIAEKLEFILTAYPITDAVWSMRQLGVANADAAKTALGAILLTLAQQGIDAAEMQRSRACLLLTGSSKPDANKLQLARTRHLHSTPDHYISPCTIGLAWLISQHLIDWTPSEERTVNHSEVTGTP